MTNGLLERKWREGKVEIDKEERGRKERGRERGEKESV